MKFDSIFYVSIFCTILPGPGDCTDVDSHKLKPLIANSSGSDSKDSQDPQDSQKSQSGFKSHGIYGTTYDEWSANESHQELHPPMMTGMFYRSFKSTELGDAIVRDTKPCHYLKAINVKLVDHLEVTPGFDTKEPADNPNMQKLCECSSSDGLKQTQDSPDSPSNQEINTISIDIGKWNKDNPNDQVGVFQCYRTWLLAPIKSDGSLKIPLRTQYAYQTFGFTE